MQKNQNNLEYFQSQIFKIPKEIKLEILSVSQPFNTKIDKKLEGFQGKPSFFLKCSGPLGSTLVNLQKFDKFGLCFFEIKELRENNKIEKYLKISIKTFKKSIDNTNTDKIPEKSAAFFQLFSSLYKQTLEGIMQGYVLYLELHGVGFRANFHEKKEFNSVKKFLEFKLGQSHDIFYEIPTSIQVFLVKPTVIGLYGIDKEKVTQIGAQLRHLKLPDPYKGKGIRYKDEIVKTKTGKKK
jgi:large subunit ribosomal protein L6